MSLIHKSLLDTVVALGKQQSDGSITYSATGFLYGHPAGKNKNGVQQHWVFLVTNRHVVEGPADLWVRFNGPKGSSPKPHPLPTSNTDIETPWTFHPDGDVDIAAMPVGTDLLPLPEVTRYIQGEAHVFALEKLREGAFSEEMRFLYWASR